MAISGRSSRGAGEPADIASELGFVEAGAGRGPVWGQLEDAWHADPPDVMQRLRHQHLRPHLDAFFAWAEAEYQRVRNERGGSSKVQKCQMSVLRTSSEIRTPPLSFAVQTPWLVAGSGLARALRFAV